MNRIRTAATFALAATLFAAGAAHAQETWSWNRAMSAGQTLEIKGVNGGITLVPGGGGEARVTAVKTGRRSNPREVAIEVVEHAGGITICAVYPNARGRQPNECRPGSGGRMQVENNDVNVEFSVRVPAGINVIAATVNGGIEGENLPAAVTARTVNGSVTLGSSGVVRATTVNGSIDVSMARADWSGELKLESVNGSVTARMPANLSAEVSAATVTGDLNTDFPLTVSGRFGGRRINGTVGSGGRSLDLKTVNGSVSLLRRQ